MELAKRDFKLPNAEKLMQQWRKDAAESQIELLFGTQEFGDKVFLYVTYPLKGNALFGTKLMQSGWERSIMRFGGFDIKAPGRTLKRIMLTQYRIQVSA